MCIVVVSPKGQEWPSVENIQNCVDSNPDGFAVAWNENGEVKNYKTMGYKAIMKFYKNFIKEHDPMETAMVFHARIATHGSKKMSNCHCWISDGMAFAHNGILSVANRGDMTDSETFFEDIFLPIYRACGWEAAEKAVRACIGSSKFAFIEGDGTVKGYGNYNQSEGNYYSNYSWQSYKSVYKNWSGYGNAGTGRYLTASSQQSTKKTSDDNLIDDWLKAHGYDVDEADWD